MRKKLYFILFFGTILHAFSYGQALKTIVATAQYSVNYIKNNQKLINDVCQLEVSKTGSYFYSIGKQENLMRIQRKYEKAAAEGSAMKIDRGDLLSNLCNFEIEKDYAHKKAFYIQAVGSQNLAFYIDSLGSSRWKLQKEVMTINNLLCHKAIMTKDTIHIVAWYCVDIPLRDGPNYYYGLPGLIVKATTNTGFDITLLSLSYNKDADKVLKIKPYAVVTEAQLKKAILNQRALYKNGTLPNGDAMKPVSGN